jgi:hypothetical protein
VLYQLSCSREDYEICCLVREGKVDIVQVAYPNATVVQGGLDDVALIEEESRKADVVIREYTTETLVLQLIAN